jgi:hypothetical protein
MGAVYSLVLSAEEAKMSFFEKKFDMFQPQPFHISLFIPFLGLGFSRLRLSEDVVIAHNVSPDPASL